VTQNVFLTELNVNLEERAKQVDELMIAWHIPYNLHIWFWSPIPHFNFKISYLVLVWKLHWTITWFHSRIIFQTQAKWNTVNQIFKIGQQNWMSYLILKCQTIIISSVFSFNTTNLQIQFWIPILLSNFAAFYLPWLKSCIQQPNVCMFL